QSRLWLSRYGRAATTRRKRRSSAPPTEPDPPRSGGRISEVLNGASCIHQRTISTKQRTERHQVGREREVVAPLEPNTVDDPDEILPPLAEQDALLRRRPRRQARIH